MWLRAREESMGQIWGAGLMAQEPISASSCLCLSYFLLVSVSPCISLPISLSFSVSLCLFHCLSTVCFSPSVSAFPCLSGLSASSSISHCLLFL